MHISIRQVAFALSVTAITALFPVVSLGWSGSAAAQTGALDPTFGVGGTSSALTVDWRLGAYPSMRGVLAAGAMGPVVTGPFDRRVLGFTDSGAKDTGFGAGGISTLPTGFSPERIFALRNGKLVVVGATKFSRDAALTLTSTGQIDPSVNGGAPGVVSNQYIQDVAARPAGGYSVLTTDAVTGDGSISTVGPDGSSTDTSYGAGGTLAVFSPLGDFSSGGWGTDGSFAAVFLKSGLPHHGLVTLYSASGVLVSSFGSSGTVDIGTLDVTSIAVLADGGVALTAQGTTANDDLTHRVLLGPDGVTRLDSTYSNSSVACGTSARADQNVLVRPAGGVFYVGTSVSGDGCNPTAFVDAYRSEGQLDTAFGQGGSLQIAGQTGASSTVDFLGRLYVGGRTVVGDATSGQDRLTRVLPSATTPVEAATSLVPLSAPGRVLDSRPSGGTVDGLHQRTGRIAAGGTYELPIAGRAGVPVDASSVVLNVTVVDPSAAGFVTVFPCGQPRPDASNLNYKTGDVIPNAVLAKVGAGGKVCFYSYAATDLLVDVAGYFKNPPLTLSSVCSPAANVTSIDYHLTGDYRDPELTVGNGTAPYAWKATGLTGLETVTNQGRFGFCRFMRILDPTVWPEDQRV